MIPENTQIGKISGWTGSHLRRPECVLAHSSGLLIVPNWTANGGISVISPGGETHHILSNQSSPIRPNGIALEADGAILLAHMGEQHGGIFRLSAAGELSNVVQTVNGQPMPPANFVVKDNSGRIWITVSTRVTPRANDYRASANTGFIAVAEPGQTNATIVADGLGYTNECVLDESRGRLYVNETFARRLSAFELDNNSFPTLSNRSVVHIFEEGTYPDGLALDERGDLWVTSIVSNRIIKVSPSGESRTIFEDSVDQHIQWTESAYKADKLSREHLDTIRSASMKNLSNLAFGTPKRNRLYLGNLLGDTLPYIDTDIAGEAMVHWDVALGELEKFL